MNGTPALVNDVMTQRVVALRTGAVFKDIVKVMREWRVSALPVLDDAGRVVGVVSESDLLLKEEYRDGDTGGHAQDRHSAEARKANAVTAAELMTAPAVTVAADATLAQAARLMARHRVKRLPVVDREGLPQGIVSRSDLLRVFLRDDADIAEEVRRDVVRLLGARATTVRVEVRDGVVTLAGGVRETALIPLAARLARSVPGVVDVRNALAGPPRRPDLDPDLPDTGRVHTP
ncbi:CBS domain-containing protein [Streptomyces sp. 5-8]|uniref:CBS domain-containing protein n=1 Tax=Streptomyces musisoli TaxID=2802280 RepID=A0ABS1P9F2_9ACTN|nr:MULTISPECIES: CBS domain-containing protein [Streptomyces]MBL1109010.1 CBS domain-containing protein [Streptomyces musisoli]MBY8845746.1 CBS domain-containing protein [Streptomyces sp. SP2-10]